MKKPFKPYDEKVRLRTLKSLNILDTAFEERFDRLTRIAKKTFNVPIALVSFIDEDRQWFKSCIGLDVRETPRDISFCGHTILGKEIFVIPDASKDARFADNPLVTGKPNIRFYAGFPLKFSDGSQLGTLCIIDQKPREFSKGDIEVLTDLGQMVERELAANQLATIDDVTNILNRRGFLMLGQHSLNLCVRQGQSSVLVYIDLNKFKQINDTFGHTEGDKALAEFSRLISETCRESDLVARVGGDEFTILFNNTTKENVDLIISRLEETIYEYQQHSNDNYNMTFSYGVIGFNPNQHKTIEALIKDADSKMYERKNINKQLDQA